MTIDKREARKEYKSKETPKGIFALRCNATGEVWVSASTHVDTARNGLWYQLRGGLHLNRKLQSVWDAQGEGAFEYDILETLSSDLSPLLVKDTLRDRQKHWQTQLGAALV